MVNLARLRRGVSSRLSNSGNVPLLASQRFDNASYTSCAIAFRNRERVKASSAELPTAFAPDTEQVWKACSHFTLLALSRQAHRQS